MTTPITAKVVEVPPPERPDLWIGFDGEDEGDTSAVHANRESVECLDYKCIGFLPGTRTLAAQAAERVRVLAGLKELADRDLDKRFLTAPERNMVTAAIAYIEGNKP